MVKRDNILPDDFTKHRPMLSYYFEHFINPFRHLAEHTLIKLSVVGVPTIAQTVGLFELFNTPEGYFWSLIVLVICDALSKSWAILFRRYKEWSLDYFIRKMLYKCGAYLLIVIPFTVFSNQWEGDTNYAQYGAYVGLSVLELISISRHLKLIGWLSAFIKMLVHGKFDLEALREEADKLEVQHDPEEVADE